MKRDLELWRAILIKVEDLPPGRDLSSPLEIDGYEEEVVAEHVKLLEEAGLIEAQMVIAPNWMGVKQVEHYVIFRLLNEGHEFVANAKNPKIWKKFSSSIGNNGGDVSLAVTKGVLTKIALEFFGL
ncbi:DUF2513 domain-containing protein [Oscillatoria sp. CS-180]|uniref:DUF2513 domain-containing protein n=1 Tax=Oscillatoria sp. CS-180 TaxID=3021720 RepID=UPI00232BDB0E|nr:DUF2513 domain-containing protein [Oscillatoria sp. CS-180]MDB9529061.1 DUF2513 domain-containing protein [Oscillatoria sp. CS-180]